MPEPSSPAIRVGPAGEGGGSGLGVFAARALAPGDFIARFEGVKTSARTRMSLQFGPREHVEPAEGCPLRFLNLACEPNAAFRGLDLHAVRETPAGVEITIDYNAHEDELAHPFACGCGAENCVGTVRGRRFLNRF